MVTLKYYRTIQQLESKNTFEWYTIWLYCCCCSKEKQSAEFQEMLGSVLISVMIKKERLRWFGYAEEKDDANGIKRHTTLGAVGSKFTWYDDNKKNVWVKKK